MSPIRVIYEDGRQEAASEAAFYPTGLTVSTIRVRHDEVSLFDEQGRESVLITRGTYPGAGMCVNCADHVELT